jgi:hypothetical protein
MTTSTTAKPGQARGAAGWLSLAASPTFAVMACIAASNASPMALCTPGSSIGGMAAMYLLMSLFHLSPWLKLASAHI